MYTTDDEIAEAAVEIVVFKQRPEQKAVGFAEDLKDEAPRCSDAVSEQRTKSIFEKGLPLSVCGNMRINWAARPSVQLRQLGQYADKRMQLGETTPSLSKWAPSPRKSK